MKFKYNSIENGSQVSLSSYSTFFQCPLLELVARSHDCPSKVKGVILKMSLQNHDIWLCAFLALWLALLEVNHHDWIPLEEEGVGKN